MDTVKEHAATVKEAAIDQLEVVIGAAAGGDKPDLNKNEESEAQAEARKNIEALKSGLAHSRIYWSTSIVVDYWFYVKQSHTVLGVFLAHDRNPFKRHERAWVWLSNAIAAFGLALLLVKADGTSDAGLDTQAAAMTGAGILAFGNIIQTEALKCRLCQAGSLLGFCENTAEKWGRRVAIIGMINALLILGGGLIRNGLRTLSLEKVLISFVESNVISWGLNWFVVTCWFTIGWWGTPFPMCNVCCQPQKTATGHCGKKYPHGVDYPKDGSGPSGDRAGCCLKLPAEGCPPEPPV